MADGDLVFQKGLGHGRYEVSQFQTTVNIRLALSRSWQQGGDGVRLAKFQKRLEAESFLQRVDVLALQVLNALRLDCLGIGQFDYANRKCFAVRRVSPL